MIFHKLSMWNGKQLNLTLQSLTYLEWVYYIYLWSLTIQLLSFENTFIRSFCGAQLNLMDIRTLEILNFESVSRNQVWISVYEIGGTPSPSMQTCIPIFKLST